MSWEDTSHEPARENQPPSHFATTHWSVVLAAGRTDQAAAAAALERLCHEYWFPVYSFIRRKGRDAHQAEDLTQEFFARLLEKNWLESADPDRGRFRTFLLTAVSRFLANEQDKDRALKRGGGQRVLSFDAQDAEGRYLLEPSSDLTPEKIFEQQWAHQVLAVVLEKLQAEFDGGGRAGRFEAMKAYLLGDRGAVSYAETAARLGLSESAVKSGIHRLRQRYGDLLREEIAQTVESPAGIEEEIAHLLGVLGD
jgi:RNA polymerase sigma-70 factor (ECF subfamily)